MEYLKGKKIAIYGTGNNAKVILRYVTSLNFVCVISEEYDEGFFCGYPVVTLDVAVGLVDTVLIAAVPTSTAIIYQKIYGSVPPIIDIYDMRGHKLNNAIGAKEFLQSISRGKSEKKYTDLLCNEFVFTDEGKLCINTYKSIAYIVAPITIRYISYIFSYAKEYDYLLFASRDGYFLQKLYSEYVGKKRGKWAKGIYLYTSRQALENAYRSSDDRYVKYINSLGLSGKCAVVDIVTQGSVCNGILKLMGYMPDLIALGTTSVPNKYIHDEKMVHSMLGNINEEIDGIQYSFSDFSELHLFLEMLYAAKDGQFVGFAEKLVPIFDEESKYNDILITSVQKDLKECIEKMILCDYNDFSNSYVMQILNLFYRNYACYDEKIKMKFDFDDPYDERLHKCNLIDKLGW